MEVTITILAWVGIATVAGLSAVTLLIWAMWVWESSQEIGSRYLGCVYACGYFVGLQLSRKPDEWKKHAGVVLWVRYGYLAEREPLIAAEFERHLIRERKRHPRSTPECMENFHKLQDPPAAR